MALSRNTAAAAAVDLEALDLEQVDSFVEVQTVEAAVAVVHKLVAKEDPVA